MSMVNLLVLVYPRLAVELAPVAVPEVRLATAIHGVLSVYLDLCLTASAVMGVVRPQHQNLPMVV